MERIDVRKFSAGRAWGSRLLMDLGEHSARIHWTDEPYYWHANTGNELFVVLDGRVCMHFRNGDGSECTEILTPGDVMHFSEGDEHYAEPMPEARVLVIERVGSA